MLITQSNLDALFISFNKMFDDAMQKVPVCYDQVATVIQSGTRDQRYPFVQALSGSMREWLGARVVNNLAVDAVVVTNKKWENTIQVQRTDIEDDQFAIYSSMLIPSLASEVKRLPDKRIAAAIAANDTGYDGVDFFSASHPQDPTVSGSPTQVNTYANMPLNSTNLAQADAYMRSFKNPAGDPLGVMPDCLMVPNSLKWLAMQLCNSSLFPINTLSLTGSGAGAAENVFKGTFKVVVNPYLPDTGNPATAVWYLLDTSSRGIRPFIWQTRTAPEFSQLVSPENPVVFDTDSYLWGVRQRAEAAGSLWFLAFQANT